MVDNDVMTAGQRCEELSPGADFARLVDAEDLTGFAVVLEGGEERRLDVSGDQA